MRTRVREIIDGDSKSTFKVIWVISEYDNGSQWRIGEKEYETLEEAEKWAQWKAKEKIIDHEVDTHSYKG